MRVRKSKIPLLLLLILLAAVFCVATFMIVTTLMDAHHSAEEISDLRDKLDRGGAAETDMDSAGEAEPHPEQSDPTETDPTDWKDALLESYAAIHEENEDFYGWLSIPETSIAYPVMHTPEQPEKYLRLAFDGTYSISGLPFMDGECREGCGNQIIYGHNMNNGTMFAELLGYTERSFWEQHPIIHFDTLNEIAEYEVVAAFYGKVYYTDETGVFRYYQYKDVSDPADFEEYMGQVRAAALYDTGVNAQPGDQLITLSTCDGGSYKYGRFVVVARKVAS